MLWDATESVLVVTIAGPEAFAAMDASDVLPSRKPTVPVGTVEMGPVFTAAVKVIGMPKVVLVTLAPRPVVVANAVAAGVSHMPRPWVAMRTLCPAVIFTSNTATLGRPVPY